MRATVMHRGGDVRVENVPDAAIKEPTDDPGRVFDRTAGLDCVPDGMNEREALKVMIRP